MRHRRLIAVAALKFVRTPQTILPPAAPRRDRPSSATGFTYMTILFIIALMVVLVNFTVDLLYVYLNPTVRLR